MVKQQIIPLTKEEMDRLMSEIEKSDDFDYMVFYILKTTGRRIGELCGIEESKEIGRKKIGKKVVYIDGKPMEVDKTIPLYKKTGKLIYGVKVKDVDLNLGVMRVWVLKRRQYIQDETILTPEAIRLISSYIRKNKLSLNDYLFREVSLRTIQNRIQNYTKKAKINHHVVVHNFRHYFVTELKRQGWTDSDIQILTGHKSVGTLSIYKHIVSSDLKDKTLESLKNL